MTNLKNARSARAIVTKSSPLVAAGKGKVAALDVPEKARAAPKVASATQKAPSAAASAAKNKLMRDSFTIPKSEYAVLEALKLRAATLARPSKKSEVLRAGIVVLTAMSDKAFVAALNAVPSLKTGRPKNAPIQAVAKTTTAKR
jgi:hypothetical protein